MMQVDVLKKFYSFNKLPQDNNYYQIKKDNYLKVKESYEKGIVDINCYPIRATLETTDYCNLNCIMCQIHSQRENHKLQQMDIKTFDTIASKLFPYLVEVHPSNIGEPLISPWFDYLCQKVKEYGILFDITTNGTLLNEDKIKNILPNLLDVKISFDGYKKETFERIRKNASYDTVVKNLTNLISLRNKGHYQGTVTLQMTVFNFNYTELIDIIKFAKDKGVDRVKAYHAFAYSDDIDKYSMFRHLEDFEPIRIQAIKLAEEYGMALELSEPEVEGNSTDNLIKQQCRLPWMECFIDYDATVYPCHSHNHIRYGNLISQDLDIIFNGDYAKNLRQCLASGCIQKNVICQGCGMNYLKYDENQPVPYNKSDYLFKKSNNNEPVKWSNRNKQFLLNR